MRSYIFLLLKWDILIVQKILNGQELYKQETVNFIEWRCRFFTH